MATTKAINDWLDRFDTMAYYQLTLSPAAHAQRRALYCDALANMTDDALNAAGREWLKTGKRYPTPADLLQIEADAYHVARVERPAPEHMRLAPPAAGGGAYRRPMSATSKRMADGLADALAGQGRGVGGVMAGQLLSLYVGIVEQQCGRDEALGEVARLEVRAGMPLRSEFVDELKAAAQRR